MKWLDSLVGRFGQCCRRRRKDKRGEKQITMELIKTMPAKEQHKLDFECTIYLAGRWQNRRAVLTKGGLFFSLVGEEEIKDHIPLHEISCVAAMADNENTEEEELEAATIVGYMDKPPEEKTPVLKKSSTLTTYRFLHAFQVDTIEDGYNSGRSYHIRAESKERCDSIMATISTASIKARKAAMKASRFQESQQMVLRFHTNPLFQFVITSLILLVSQICISCLHRIAT